MSQYVFPQENNAQFFFTVIVIFVSLCLALALFFDYFQVHIYRHDASYYYTMELYLHNLKSEGRWINYFFFPVYSVILGKIAIFLNLLFFVLFVFTVCFRWTRNASYALLLSLLCLQLTPLTALLMWPAGALPVFALLFLASILAPSLPVYIFYPLFGMLLFGTASNFYYLLPLAHLYLFDAVSIRQNIKVLFNKILPAWALGYVAGYLFMLLILYIVTGQLGIEIADWREPNYIGSIQDISDNIFKSYNYLTSHLNDMFDGVWRKELLAFALMLGLAGTNKSQSIPVVILSISIIVVHYIVVLPVGMNISPRTAVATWLGVLVLVFFYPVNRDWRYFVLLPVIIAMTFSFYNKNHESLKWYASITNIYYNELLRVSPLPPELYSGVVFLSPSKKVQEVTSIISSKLHLKKGLMEGLGDDFRWAPIAAEVGFKKILFCNGRHRGTAVCYDIAPQLSGEPIEQDGSMLYQVVGEYNGYLIISLNDRDYF